MSSPRICRTAVLAAVVASFVAPGAAATPTSEPQEAERHCVIAVTDVRDGVFVTDHEVCFDTPAEADSHAASLGATPPGSDGSTWTASTHITIGTHFTSTSYAGSTVRVVGTTCGGGVWYPTGAWNNNIESSLHHCGSAPTGFYDSPNCVKTPKRIYSAASSLGNMNNRASCVRYG